MDDGLYERLITERLRDVLERDKNIIAEVDHVEDVEQPLALARHLHPIIEASLRNIRSSGERIDVVNRILALLAMTDLPADDLVKDSQERAQQLLSLTERTPFSPSTVRSLVRRPLTPLSDAALLTNARGEPGLASELNAELARGAALYESVASTEICCVAAVLGM